MSAPMMITDHNNGPSVSSGSSPGMGGGGQPSVGIGNYKGVMLCNRPFAGVQAAAQGIDAVPSKAAFVCGTVSDKLGTNVPVLSKEKSQAAGSRPKKVTALARHKKWLNELQKTKDTLESQYLSDLQSKEDRHSKFMEREAKMRAMVRAAKDQAAAEIEADLNGDGPEIDEEDEAAMAQIEQAETRRTQSGRVAKPAWAMTAEDAEITAMVDEELEADDLVDFAKGLDFDKYINDVEISTMIDKVRNRIATLEKEEEDEAAMAEAKEELSELLAQEKEERQQGRLTMENLHKLDGPAESKGADDFDDAKSVAKSVLSEDKAIGAVHSEKSLGQVAEARKTAIASAMAAIQEEHAPAPPKMVKHTDDDGARLEQKNHVSNLPYIHRNPAV